MRALEDAISSHRHRWPKEWDGKSPLSGGMTFNDMGNTQRVRLAQLIRRNGCLMGPVLDYAYSDPLSSSSSHFFAP